MGAAGLLAGAPVHALTANPDNFSAVEVVGVQQDIGNVLVNDSGGVPPLNVVFYSPHSSSAGFVENVQFSGEVIFSWSGECNVKPAQFNYKVRDESDPVQYANSFFTINLVPPVKPDYYTTQAGTTLSGNVVDNDPRVNGRTLPVVLDSGPSHGHLLLPGLTQSGDFQYQPDPGFTGVDHFSYKSKADTANCFFTADVIVNVVPPAVAVPALIPWGVGALAGLLGVAGWRSRRSD